MYYVYILKSEKDGKCYVGLTSNLKRKLQEHNAKQVKSTKARTPFTLVYNEQFETRTEARKREKFLKSGSGREQRDNLIYSAVAQR